MNGAELQHVGWLLVASGLTGIVVSGWLLRAPKRPQSVPNVDNGRVWARAVCAIVHVRRFYYLPALGLKIEAVDATTWFVQLPGERPGTYEVGQIEPSEAEELLRDWWWTEAGQRALFGRA